MVIYNWPSIIFGAVVSLSMVAAIIFTVLDKALPTINKVIWVVVIVIFPVFGVVVWAMVRLFKRLTHTTSTP
jgi:hypothetical protein